MSAAYEFTPIVDLCSGIGDKDTHAEILSDGKANTHPAAGTKYPTMDVAEIFSMVGRPQTTDKSRARWVIPSSHTASDARSHSAQRECGLFWMLPLDVDSGNLSIEEVDRTLFLVLGDVARTIYSTRSSKSDNRKWRALAPLLLPIAGADYQDTANAFFDLLEERSGGVLITDRALARPGQLIFLPNKGEFYEHRVVDNDWTLLSNDHPVIRRRDDVRRRIAAAEAEIKAARARKAAQRPTAAGSVIEAFNRANNVEDRLLGYGYVQSGNDFRSPYQASGSFATRLFGDRWISLSASDVAAGVGRASADGHCSGDAFDLFAHYEHGGDATAAVRAYAEEIGRELPPRADARDEFDAVNDNGPAPKKPSLIKPSPFVYRSPETIPRREWLYGHHLSRGFISATVAHPGVGKTTLAVVDTLALVSGKNLIGNSPDGKLRVWYWNGEDPREEMERRFHAAMILHGLTPDDIGDRLFLNSGRDDPICIAKQTRDGITLAVPEVENLVSVLTENRIDVVMIDPFISSHRVTENDNNAVDAVVKAWASLVDRARSAADLIHHLRKTGGAEGTVEDARGASALVAAVRSARVLNGMTKEEGKRLGVENHFDYLRVGNGKSSMARRMPVEKEAWLKMASVPLGNGDHVGALTDWVAPDPTDDLQPSDLLAVQEAVAKGQWRENVQASDWVGKAVASALGLDLSDDAEKARVKAMVKRWLADGSLIEAVGLDYKRNERVFIQVGKRMPI